jgi:hypothetical protein
MSLDSDWGFLPKMYIFQQRSRTLSNRRYRSGAQLHHSAPQLGFDFQRSMRF